jgi:hypothetical protein
MAIDFSRWKISILLACLCAAAIWNLNAQVNGQNHLLRYVTDYWQAWHGSDDQGLISAPGAKNLSDDKSLHLAELLRNNEKFELQEISQFRATIERPIFQATRRPPESVGEVAIGTVDRPKLMLIGIVITAENRTAILRREQPSRDGNLPSVLHLNVGDLYNGWKLAEINGEVARFEYGEEQFLLELEFEKPPKPAPKKSRRRAIKPAPVENDKANKPAKASAQD